VTGTGGDVLFVEATAMDGGHDLLLTGQLGDVMKESARIASAEETKPIAIDRAVVRDALGRPKVFHEAAIRTAVPGVATGLAVTGVGGAPRSPRSGAESRLPRSLPRRRARSVAGALRRDRQRCRHDPGRAGRSYGDHPLRRLYDARESGDRARASR